MTHTSEKHGPDRHKKKQTKTNLGPAKFWRAQVRRLERSNVDLKEQIQLLETEKDHQRSAAAAAAAGMELERRRADVAEAEVARLKSILAGTGSSVAE